MKTMTKEGHNRGLKKKKTMIKEVHNICLKRRTMREEDHNIGLDKKTMREDRDCSCEEDNALRIKEATKTFFYIFCLHF